MMKEYLALEASVLNDRTVILHFFALAQRLRMERTGYRGGEEILCAGT
ncbi:hypothetical protein [Lapidilactobacillus bayanensis]|nr:hypothetical protein [Lapidilactobacillus bayanensis]